MYCTRHASICYNYRGILTIINTLNSQHKHSKKTTTKKKTLLQSQKKNIRNLAHQGHVSAIYLWRNSVHNNQRFHRTTFLFLSAEANSCPLGCQAHDTISLLCSFFDFDFPVNVSQTNRVPSLEPAATYCPSGLVCVCVCVKEQAE